jgi:hypothetical protein
MNTTPQDPGDAGEKAEEVPVPVADASEETQETGEKAVEASWTPIGQKLFGSTNFHMGKVEGKEPFKAGGKIRQHEELTIEDKGLNDK